MSPPDDNVKHLDPATLHAAHDLSAAALGGPVRVQDGRLVDGHGRTLSLRGFNVAGASKVPTNPDAFTHCWDPDAFYRHRAVTFVGRPFPLKDAPLHLRRLQAWGLPLVRLLVTWESIAHAGPNPTTDIDLDYVDYLRQLLDMMPAYGIKCFICAHQDVWSRYCGGSGAPGWTLEASGLNMEAFHDTGAAYMHGQDLYAKAHAPPNERQPSGPFVWPSGNQKLAASTMATLFWAGDALAPNLTCLRSPLSGHGPHETVSVQQFLQDACTEAFGRLADALGPLEACLGFEPMNEPDRGLVNLPSFHAWNYNTDLHIGFYPSFLQALALGTGFAQDVPYYVKSWPFPTRKTHMARVDPKGRTAWLPKDDSTPDPVDRPRGMGQCVWRAHGVWDWDEKKQRAVVLQKDYFDHDHRPGREKFRLDWYRDCYAPFVLKFSERVSRHFTHHLSFVEPLPNQFMPPWELDPKAPINLARPRNFVYAPHFYDLNVLFSKAYHTMSVNVQGLARGMFLLKALYFGPSGLRRNYAAQLRNLVQHAHKFLGPVPILIGEVGIPFDINNRKAFQTGDYTKQRQLLHGLIAAMEDNLLGFTLWNYNPLNTAAHGDGWNDEDFSILTSHPYTPDSHNQAHEHDELYRGARCLDVALRPYAVKTAGKPVRSDWDPQTLHFEFEWEGNSHHTASRLTEVYLPAYHYGTHHLVIHVSDGVFAVDAQKQSLYVLHDADDKTGTRHQLTVDVRHEETPSRSSGQWLAIGAVIAVLLAVSIMLHLKG